ncbi:perilipin-3-like isoform X2 [Carettochelys insculpta]|uniref:perilipin-3-like isoform X2 n=1 Tax=Carettochelys insculpta TaxID=44489 RepID=UPI003EC1118A
MSPLGCEAEQAVGLSGFIMSGNENAADLASQGEMPEQPQQNVVARVASLPLVSSTYDMVSTAYASTKDNHPYIKSVCDVAEKGVKTITAAAVGGAQPILTKLEPQIATVNEYACKGLDKLEAKLPILQQPSEKVVADTKELVSSTVTGARDAVSNTVNGAKEAVTGVVDMAKGAVQGSVEMTRSVVTSSMNTVMGSRVGQMVVTGVDAVLGKSEELVDHYLPMTDQELAKLATSVEGFEMASVEQQRQQQSYFVRLGSLSTKLRHRAYQHSLGKLRSARQNTHEALSQLHQTIELIENIKQGVDQKLHNGQEKLHQMWLEWSRRQSGGKDDSTATQPEVESRTLAMFRSTTQQLQATCLSLMANVQGLPTNIQDKVQQLRHNVEELHTSFSAARSFQDLSNTILTQSRERVAKARESMDELLDYVVQNTPLPWLVGPFAPRLVEQLQIPAAEQGGGGCTAQQERDSAAQQAAGLKEDP